MNKEFDERNAEKSRAVCEAMAERADTGKRKLTERERQILDMWPRFEDGEPVMVGDEAISSKGLRFTVKRIEFRHWKWMLNDSVTEGHYLNGKPGERVKRPARSVLDADGVEIKVGDTVWNEDGSEWLVEEMNRYGVRCFDGGKRRTFIPAFLTHTRPDSWERLEEDAQKYACDYFGVECDSETRCRMCPHFRDDRDCSLEMNADIVRRAKALAGVEVG